MIHSTQKNAKRGAVVKITLCFLPLFILFIWGIFYLNKNIVTSYYEQNDKILIELFNQLNHDYQFITSFEGITQDEIDSLNFLKKERASAIEESVINQISERLIIRNNDVLQKIDDNTKLLFISGSLFTCIILLAILLLFLNISTEQERLVTGQDNSEDEFTRQDDKFVNRDVEKVEMVSSLKAGDELESFETNIDTPIFVVENPPIENPVFTPVVKEDSMAEIFKDYEAKLAEILNMADQYSMSENFSDLEMEVTNDNILPADRKDLLLYQIRFYQAQLLVSGNNTEKALEIYSDLIQINSDQPRVYLERANVYMHLSEYEKAINDYSEALRIKSDYSQAYYKRGEAYYKSGNAAMALKDFHAVLDLDVYDANAYYYCGLINYESNNFDNAISNIESVIRIDPDRSIAYNLLGMIYLNMGKIEDAVDQFSIAIDKDSECSQAFKNRGDAYKTLSKYDLAINDYNQALILDPNFATILLSRGDAFFQIQEYEKAIPDFNVASEIDPENPDIYLKRGASYFKIEDYDQAMSDFDKVLQIVPQNEDAMDFMNKISIIEAQSFVPVNHDSAFSDLNDIINHATQSLDRGQYDTAIDYLNEAISLNQDNSFAFYMRGLAQSYLKNFEKAILDFDESVSLYPNNAEVYYCRGNAYTNLRKYDEAIGDYTAATSINPYMAEAFFNKGNIHYNRKQYDIAINDYTKALGVNSEYTKAYFNRGLAYRFMDDKAKALNDFEKVILLSPQDQRVVEKAQKQIDLMTANE